VQGKIVIVSQHDPLQLLPSAIAAGANACVDKSHLVSDLVMTIKKLNLAADNVQTRSVNKTVDSVVA
jgi:DNA-binding NarL/FixJ family response regulator